MIGKGVKLSDMPHDQLMMIWHNIEQQIAEREAVFKSPAFRRKSKAKVGRGLVNNPPQPNKAFMAMRASIKSELDRRKISEWT